VTCSRADAIGTSGDWNPTGHANALTTAMNNPDFMAQLSRFYARSLSPVARRPLMSP
jgi:hypothetical protein